MNRFEQSLAGDEPIILDGGLATHLETMGFDIGGVLWSAAMLDRNPRAIVDAHRAYLDAGADVIISASYQASRAGFMSLGKTAAEADRLISSSVELALAARREFLADNPGLRSEPLVAASIGPYGASLADGSEYAGGYGVGDDVLRRFHEERLAVLDAAGADVLAVETIPDMREARILRDLLARAVTPSWVAFSCRDERCISDGMPLADAAALFAAHETVLALGINCTPPGLIVPLIGEIRRSAPGRAIVVYPNSGETYHAAEKCWSGVACDLDHDFAVTDWFDAGARLIGGCCRTGPDDIASIRARLSARRVSSG